MLLTVAYTLISGLPLWLVLLVAVLWAALTVRRHPSASLLAIAGYGGLLIFACCSTLLWTPMPAAYLGSLPQWAWVSVSFVESAAGAVFLVLIGASILAGRFGGGDRGA